jgi:hypothetical protein
MLSTHVLLSLRSAGRPRTDNSYSIISIDVYYHYHKAPGCRATDRNQPLLAANYRGFNSNCPWISEDGGSLFKGDSVPFQI